MNPSNLEKAISQLQIDLRALVPGMPEHASIASVPEYQMLHLLHPEMAGATSAVGKYAIFLMYLSLSIYLSDKKLVAPKSLVSDIRAAANHVPDAELMRKYKFTKTMLLKEPSKRWIQDQLVDLRGLNRRYISNDTTIPENERKLFTLALRICRGSISPSSIKSLEKIAWVISPDLGAKVTKHIHGESNDSTSAGKKAAGKELDAIHSAIKNLVKQLGGSGLTLSLDKANTARNNAKLEPKYKEYLRMRSELRRNFEIEFRKAVVNNGNKPIDAKDAEKLMQSKGFELMFIPTNSMGFTGKIGIHNGKMALFTSTDKMIHGNIAPGSTVRMNKKYDPVSDNNYVMVVKAPGALTNGNRLYTTEYKRGSASSKFKKADDLGRSLPALMKAWAEGLKSNDPLKRMNATASVCLYLTGARAGSRADAMASKKGVAGYGMMNIRNKHVKVTATSIIFSYPGKKGVLQKHVIPLKDKSRKLIGKYILQLKKDKDPNDPLWTMPSLTGKRTVTANYTTLTRYLKSIGLTQGAHKLRHVRGTELAKKLLATTKFKFSTKANTLPKKKKEADDYMKNKILSKVADLLGHRATGSDGKLKMAWNTSIQSYVNPNIVRDWYKEHKLDVPTWVPDSVTIEK